jgi:hypothetical protein
MHADPKRVVVRRWKRRAKAVASIAVALCAGAFLAACGKTVATPPDAGDRKNADAETGTDASIAVTITSDGGSDAGFADSAITDARSDALAKPRSGARDAAVDVREHRKGMPVPDNLLE